MILKVAHVVYGASYSFYCPGCKCIHQIETRNDGKQPSWDFNNDLNYPTFSPSILVSYSIEGEMRTVCHSFVRDGFIQFLQDSTHELAGQTVRLPEYGV